MASPYDKYWARPDDGSVETPKSRPVQAPRRAPRDLRPHQHERVTSARSWGDTVSDAFRYVDDTVRLLANGATFGYADKIAARADALFSGRSYRQELKQERAQTAKARKGQSVKVPLLGDVAPAEIVGGILSPANKLSMGVKTVRGFVGVGAAEGFVAGMGYSDAETWGDTLADGARMVPYGALGGLVAGGVVKTAKAVKLRATKKAVTKPDVEVEAWPSGTARDNEPLQPVTREAAGIADDAKVRSVEPEEGALATSQALKETPDEAVASAAQRIAAMTDDEAVAWAARVEKAEMDGTLLDDPHYRSIMNVDLSDVDVAPEKLLRAVNAAEEIHEAVLDRVATRKVGTSKIDADVANQLRSGLGDDEIEEMVKRSEQGIRDNRVASVLMARAGVEAVRAHDVFKEAAKANAEGAAQALRDTLSRALWVYQKGAVIRSNAGRSLQIGQEKNPHLNLTGDDLWEFDKIDITGKVEEAFNELGAEGVSKLLAKLRSGDDLGDIFDAISRPERAKAVNGFRRAVGSFEAFLKSNALTPVTAVFNGLGAVLHDSFRNGVGRRWAAARAAMNGEEMEALGLRLELEAANEAYARAHLYGLKAMLDRIKFDFWDSVEGVAGVGFGSGKVRAMASVSKQALAAKGTFSTNVRELSSQNPNARLRVNDLDAFNARMDELASSGGFGKVMAAATRVGAVSLNTVDALGTAAGKLFTGAVDEWGKGFAAFKEQYALAARSAMKEALEANLDPAAIPEFVKRRTQAKVDIPDDEMWARAEEAILRGHEPDAEVNDFLARKAAVEHEALKVTLQDGPQTELGKASANFLSKLDPTGIVLPYIRTPIRLLERGLIDYTPFGRFADEGRKIIARGGPEAAMFKAQMEIGATVAALGTLLGASGLFVVTNGDWDNAKNMEGEPALRLQIGDFHVELGRLDPFVTTLALGALWGQAAKDGFTDYAQYGDFEQARQAGLATAAFGLKDAVLSKSYLRGLKDFIDMIFDGSANKVEKLAGSVAARMIPLGGTQKLVNETVRENAIEAVSISDTLYRNLIGVGIGLPTKRNALGDPIEGRDGGVSIGLSNDTVDDVGRKLKEMGFDLQDVKRTDPKGGRLSAQQLDRLRYIRGHLATDSEGRTMREALAELLTDPLFLELGSKAAQQDLINETIRDFNKPAREAMEDEDADFAAMREARVTFEEYLKQGASLTEAERQTEEDTSQQYGTDFQF